MILPYELVVFLTCLLRIIGVSFSDGSQSARRFGRVCKTRL